MTFRLLGLSICLTLLLTVVLSAADAPKAAGPEPASAPATPPSAVATKLSSAIHADADRESRPSREEAILAALAKPVSLDCDHLALADVLQYLRQSLGVQILVDTKEKSMQPDTDLSFHVRDVSGRAALSLVLEPLELDWTIHNDVVWISTPTIINSMLTTKVYDVTDLVASSDDSSGGVIGDNFISLITGAVDSRSWTDAGGEGSITPFNSETAQLLVISQDHRHHEQVAALLADLRTAIKSHPKTTAGGKANSGNSTGPQSTSRGAPMKGGANEGPQPEPAATDVSPRRAVVNGNNQFACDLFQHAADGGSNFAFSPLSIELALGMTYAGAREKTAEEMAAALHFTLPPADLHTALGAMSRELSAKGSGDAAQLRIANRVWLDNHFAPLDSYQNLLTMKYDADAKLLDFQGDADSSRTAINDWTASQTNQEIKEIVPPGGVDLLTHLVLTNAVYFNGQWTKPFDRESTHPEKFFGLSRTAEAPLMYAAEQCRYAKIDDVQIVEKPYAGSSLAMTIILPKKGAEPFKTLSSGLTAAKIESWIGRLRPKMIDLYVPRFNVSSLIPLKETLTALGMRSAFDSTLTTADFSGIDGRKDVYISAVLHSAIVRVDEVGTVAAAATATFGGGGGIEPPRPMLRADHPFIFLIRDTKTGCIPFMGKFVDPQGDGG